jgi:hypothetical protein
MHTNVSPTRESSGNGVAEGQQNRKFQAKFDEVLKLSSIPGGHSDILRR